MQDIAAYLRAPLYFLFLAFQFRLLGLTLLQLEVIQSGFQYAQGVLPVVQLGTGLGVLYHNACRDMPYTDSRLHFVDVLSAGSA